MKHGTLGLVATLLTLSWATAQPALEQQLTRNLQPTPERLGEIDEADKKLLIRKATSLLNQHVTFRHNGTAGSFFDTASGRQQVEWMNLRFKAILPVRISAADKDMGISKRIQAQLTYDASRTWNPQTKTWNHWSRQTHPLFPRGITLEWKNGHPMLANVTTIKQFKPGPMTGTPPSATPATAGNTTPGNANPVQPSPAGATNLPPGWKPGASGASSLPPGFSRGK